MIAKFKITPKATPSAFMISWLVHLAILVTTAAYYSLSLAALAATFALTVSASSFLSGVHRLLLLVVIFLLTAGLYLLYDFYFLGLAYIIIYCGAIAIIFLFVLMMISLHSGSIAGGRWHLLILLFMGGSPVFLFTSYTSAILHSYLYPVLASLIFPLASDIFNFSVLIYLAYPIALVIIAVALWLVLLGVIKLVSG